MKTFIAISALALGAVASATPGIEFSAPGYIGTNNTWSLGYSFQVGNSDLAVTGLGFFDDYGDGLTESHAVGIYDSSFNLVTSGTVTNSDALSGHFRYTKGSGILMAGQTYQVVAVTGSENYTWDPAGFTVSPDITFLNDVYTQSSTLVPGYSSSGGVNGWFGANFEYQAVPEPMTMAVLGLGALGMLRRRKSAK